MQNSPQKIIRFDGADAAAGGTPRPFSKAVRAGDFIYVSGQVPTVDGEVFTGGIIAQSEAAITISILTQMILRRFRYLGALHHVQLGHG